MKKLIFLISFFIILINGYSQAPPVGVKIPALPYRGGDASGGLVPVSINGQSFAVLGSQFSLGKIDSITIAPSGDTVWQWRSGIKYFIGKVSGGGGGGVTGITSINGDTVRAQSFIFTTTGTDVGLTTPSPGTKSFNFPSASSSARGPLTSADWLFFRNREIDNLGLGYRLVKKNTARDSIKTLFNGYSVSLDTISNPGGITFKFVNDVVNPGRNYVYRTDNSIVRGWFPNSYNVLPDKPSLTNYKKDSVLLYTFNTLTQTPTSMGWTKGSNYTATATESNVSDGLQIVSTSNTYTNNFTYSGYKSMASDVTCSVTMRIVSYGTILAVAGVYFGGTTSLLSHPGNAFINLTTQQVYLYTYEYGQFSVGSLVNPVSAGDIVRLSVRRNFGIYTITVYNITKNTVETFSRDETTDPLSNGVAVNNWNPGILVMNATVVYQDFKFYATTGYHADYLVLGASIQQNQWKVAYDSSFVGRLNANTNKIVALAAGAGMNDQDVFDILPEIYKLKPKAVIWGDVAYNDVNVSSQPTSTWLPLVKTIADSLMNHGIKVILEKNPPSNNTTPATINQVLDSAFTNDRRIRLLDVYKCFPLWDSSFANNCNTAYTIDGKHLNKDGGKVLADFVSRKLELLSRENFESGANSLENRHGRNKRVWIYDSTGINQGVWHDYILVGGYSISGDSLTLTGGGGGGPVISGTDTSHWNYAFTQSGRAIHIRNSLATGDTLFRILTDSSALIKTTDVLAGSSKLTVTKTLTDSSAKYTVDVSLANVKPEQFVDVTTQNYTVLSTDVNIMYGYVGTPGTITLPSSPPDGTMLWIKNISSGPGGNVAISAGAYEGPTTNSTLIPVGKTWKIVYKSSNSHWNLMLSN
jgi:hypothetical protein